MSAPAEEHHPSKKTLQQGSHPHMPLCFAIPSGQHACVQWVATGYRHRKMWRIRKPSNADIAFVAGNRFVVVLEG
jgi:hypothetical protein